VRASAFLGGWLLLHTVAVEVSPDRPDATIGLGLLAFAMVALAAGVWGLIDGVRLDFARLALVWGIVAVAMGVAVPLLTALQSAGRLSVQVLAADLFVTGPFVVGLVAVPALLGGGIGALTHRGRPAA